MLPEGFYWDFYPSRKGLLIHILDIVAHYCYLINVTAIKNIIFVFDKSKLGAEKVVYPVGCVDTCHGCGDLCPVGAITYFGDNTGWIPKALR